MFKSERKGDWNPVTGFDKKTQRSIAEYSRNPRHLEMYKWIDYVVTGIRHFSFVDDEKVKEYSIMQPTTRKTVVKWMHKLVQAVEKRLTKMLPNRFGNVHLRNLPFCTVWKF
ncbi:hypothetical protein AAMO2058_001350300 [Amorphochlora amoebiformis]